MADEKIPTIGADIQEKPKIEPKKFWGDILFCLLILMVIALCFVTVDVSNKYNSLVIEHNDYVKKCSPLLVDLGYVDIDKVDLSNINQTGLGINGLK